MRVVEWCDQTQDHQHQTLRNGIQTNTFGDLVASQSLLHPTRMNETSKEKKAHSNNRKRYGRTGVAETEGDGGGVGEGKKDVADAGVQITGKVVKES